MKRIFCIVFFIFSAFLFLCCASYKEFADSTPSPCDNLEISDEGWNGAVSTKIPEIDSPPEIEESNQ